MKDLAGKIALVTAGTRGLGRAISVALAEAGADIALHAGQNDPSGTEFAAQLAKRHGVRAHAYTAEIADEAGVLAMVDEITRDLGRIDILVNNADVGRDRSFLTMTRAMWDEALGINLNGPFNVTNAVLRQMVTFGWGRIVNICAPSGPLTQWGQTHQTVTRGGLLAFTMTLARELARKGITVNAVSPGLTATDLDADTTNHDRDQIRQAIPMGRVAEPAEIAAVVAFLVSSRASYITGQVIGVNGGMTL